MEARGWRLESVIVLLYESGSPRPTPSLLELQVGHLYFYGFCGSKLWASHLPFYILNIYFYVICVSILSSCMSEHSVSYP